MQLMEEHVIITAGVTAAIERCAWALMDPGDAVLIGRPYYAGFSVGFAARVDLQVIPVSFGKINPVSLEAVHQYEAQLVQAKQSGVRVRCILICSPHKFLGECYPSESLIAIIQLCQKHDLHLISDEIYALSIWKKNSPGGQSDHRSVLAIDTAGLIEASRVHVLWGLSKDFGASGLRVGCIISQRNSALMLAIQNISSFMAPSSVADGIAAKLLADARFADRCIMLSRTRLARNHALATRFLQDSGIHVHPGSHAGLFLWVKVPEVGLESRNGNSSKSIIPDFDMAKVLITSGQELNSEEAGWYRIIFSHEETYLMEGLRRIVHAFRG
ncbi:hypothetical protein MMC25_007854 [Agyrium rufum]|nr:hypothetical protein [Agyrium rufum]